MPSSRRKHSSKASDHLAMALTAIVIIITELLGSSESAAAAAEDPISSVCTQINKYLQSSYECHPNEFRRHVSCQDNRIEIRCPRSTQIAVHSASYGWSDRLTQSDCRSVIAYDRGCPRTCALDDVRRLCQGKRRCLLNTDDGFITPTTSLDEPTRCRSIKYLGVIHTCVKKSLLGHITSSDEIFVNPCEGEEGEGDQDEDESNSDGSEPGRPHPPFVAFPTTVAAAFRSRDDDQRAAEGRGGGVVNGLGGSDELDGGGPQSNTFSWFHQRQPSTQWRSLREGPVRNGSGGNNGAGLRPQTIRPAIQVKQVVDSTARPSIWMQSFMDWIWTWNYINENTEKFVLYLLLGLSLGTIAILFTILCHMIFCARRSPSKETPVSGGAHQGTMASCSSPTWRMPESESSTGDDRTLHDDDVELTSFNHIDSLQRHANYHHQIQHHQGTARPPSYSSRPQSPAAPTANTTTTTATISRTYTQATPVVTRCFTPSPPAMALPETSVPNGGFLPPTPLLSNGRVEVTPLHQAHNVGSLGRTYSNHYRKDSYQLDPAPGCRTLQPMQHYYG